MKPRGRRWIRLPSAKPKRLDELPPERGGDDGGTEVEGRACVELPADELLLAGERTWDEAVGGVPTGLSEATEDGPEAEACMCRGSKSTACCVMLVTV